MGVAEAKDKLIQACMFSVVATLIGILGWWIGGFTLKQFTGIMLLLWANNIGNYKSI